jgi:hypothetical protein
MRPRLIAVPALSFGFSNERQEICPGLSGKAIDEGNAMPHWTAVGGPSFEMLIL